MNRDTWRKGTSLIWKQTTDAMGLNKAEWFVNIVGTVGSTSISVSSPSWFNLQNKLHRNLSGNAELEFSEEEYAVRVEVEGVVKGKYAK